jgi:hypothetical protein
MIDLQFGAGLGLVNAAVATSLAVPWAGGGTVLLFGHQGVVRITDGSMDRALILSSQHISLGSQLS